MPIAAALATAVLVAAAACALVYRRRLRASLDALLRAGEDREARAETERRLAAAVQHAEELEAELDRARRELRRQHELRAIRELVGRRVPADARLIVVSRGDPELVKMPGRPAWHFPRAADGVYAGHHPTDSDEAIRHLEDLRAQGGRFLVVPSTAFWWLEHYRELRSYLEERYRLVERQDDACAIFDLEPTS